MLRWKEWDHDKCPRCGLPEDSKHVWKCANTQVVDLWDKAISLFQTWLEKVDTHPDLQAFIISILASRRTNTNPAIGPPSQLQELVRSPEFIGWDRFFEGFVSIEWREIQHQYYIFLKSRRTGRRWVVELLKKLWDVSWDL
jgi:hypothetical protein